MTFFKLNADVTPTDVVEEQDTAVVSENFFDSLVAGFQGIVDFILKIIDMIRSTIENITGKK